MFFNAWQEAARFNLDVQQVVTRRLQRLAAGDDRAAKEARRMVAEKVTAFSDAQVVGALAFATRGPLAAVCEVMAVYGGAVRANRRRLSRRF
jgi:hypothetical protein